MTDHSFEILKDQVQIAALAFMAAMYALKIWVLMKKNPINDRTPNHGDPNSGVRYSFATIAMPWDMECYRKRPLKYIEFAVFHIGIAVAITATIIIPYWPHIMVAKGIMVASQVVIALAFLTGVSRLARRLASPVMRMFSNPDDYFSIILLNAYLLSAFFAIPNSDKNHWTVVVFFILTTFFLVYVPFSKISHYLLWPFNRYYIGKHFGKRGVYPKCSGSLSPSK
ncbi:MAG: hypothetical protein ABIH23_16055 [bacterium]